MKSSVTIATFVALAAGKVSAGALDKVPTMLGSDAMKDLTLQVLANCAPLHAFGDPIAFDGTGSGGAENAMKIVGPSSTQLIAPMTRAMNANVCTGGPTQAQRAGAEGLVIALDAVNIVGNAANVGSEGIDYPGNAADPTNQWRTVLRLIYTGMDIAAGANVFARDCNSAARQNIVNNWDNATDQIGCLTLASPCSLGYAGRPALTDNPGTAAVAINGIENSLSTIRALVQSGTRYPMARKLYLNSTQGFDILHNSDSTVLNSDAEEEMTKCYATLPFNGTINVESPKLGLVKLPPATGATIAKPLCEDFDGRLLAATPRTRTPASAMT